MEIELLVSHDGKPTLEADRALRDQTLFGIRHDDDKTFSRDACPRFPKRPARCTSGVYWEWPRLKP